MKKRNLFVMILLSCVTFGFYPLYWYCSFQNQLKKETGLGFGGAGHFFMTFITFGVYLLYWSYAVGKRLEACGGKNNSVVYLLLSLFGMFPIACLVMQSDANKLPEKVEAPVEQVEEVQVEAE